MAWWKMRIKDRYFTWVVIILISSVAFSSFSIASSPSIRPHVDSDGDGMPDAWENLHNLNPLYAADAMKDYDGDNLMNIEEYNISIDPFYSHTHLIDPRNGDSDNDSMPDGWEYQHSIFPGNGSLALDPTDNGSAHPIGGPDGDCDNDGFDSNRNGIINDEEKHTNFMELNRVTNPLNQDSEVPSGDGMPDGWEVYYKLNPTRDDSQENPDADSYGSTILTNIEEYNLYSTYPGIIALDPFSPDSDGDGMWDGWEIYYDLNPCDAGLSEPSKGPDYDTDGDSWDSDGDGIISIEEGYTNLEEFHHGSNPKSMDSDADGMWDGWEINYGLSPNVNDKGYDNDQDGLTNIVEWNEKINPNKKDTDNDGLPDKWEVNHGLIARDNGVNWSLDENGKQTGICDPTNGADGDPDGEWEYNLDNITLDNYDEYCAGTDPFNWDTDGDLMDDAWEIKYGLNPRVSNEDEDPDHDTLLNYQEYSNGTNPHNHDSDNDGYWDINDIFPLDPTEWADLDLDGIGDNSDNDTDGDGWLDLDEIDLGTDPMDNSSYPSDNDGDFIADVNDPDDDDDGVPDELDEDPLDAKVTGIIDDTSGTDGQPVGISSYIGVLVLVVLVIVGVVFALRRKSNKPPEIEENQD